MEDEMPREEIVKIDRELCIGCGVCVDMCPQKILFIESVSGKCGVTDEKKCDRLAGCERACPVDAIKIG
jgi:ferredoxin